MFFSEGVRRGPSDTYKTLEGIRYDVPGERRRDTRLRRSGIDRRRSFDLGQAKCASPRISRFRGLRGSALSPQDTRRQSFIHVEIRFSGISSRLSMTMRPLRLGHRIGAASAYARCTVPRPNSLEVRRATARFHRAGGMPQSDWPACVFQRRIVECRSSEQLSAWAEM
jgi:hypothetical protein